MLNLHAGWFFVFLILFSQVTACSNLEIFSGQDKVQKSVASIEVTEHFGKAPLTISFNAKSFLYHFGGKTSLLWDFSNGSTSTDAITKYTFKSIGTYIVSLTYNTTYGLKGSEWVVVIVN